MGGGRPPWGGGAGREAGGDRCGATAAGARAREWEGGIGGLEGRIEKHRRAVYIDQNVMVTREAVFAARPSYELPRPTVEQGGEGEGVVGVEGRRRWGRWDGW